MTLNRWFPQLEQPDGQCLAVLVTADRFEKHIKVNFPPPPIYRIRMVDPYQEFPKGYDDPISEGTITLVIRTFRLTTIRVDGDKAMAEYKEIAPAEGQIPDYRPVKRVGRLLDLPEHEE